MKRIKILARKNLNMTPGKLAAQSACGATVKRPTWECGNSDSKEKGRRSNANLLHNLQSTQTGLYPGRRD